jgi:hypothetical protein
MNEVDTLVKEKIVPMRKRLVDSLLQKHPHILGLAEKYLAGNNNRIGMRVTENGSAVGEYTFHLSGLQIRDIEYGVLSSELHVPFGIIKPYVIVDKSVLEQMLKDEQEFTNNLFTTSWKYLPDTTVKFLR